MRRSCLLLCLTLCAPVPAYAQLDCIVPTREEGFDPRKPGAEAVRRAARAVEAIAKRNATFMAGNEPVRVRTSISYYGDASAAASVITTAYNRKAWVAGGCQVSKFADRGGGLSDGAIVVYVNDPDAMLGGSVGDGELRARLAPRRLDDHAGFPRFAESDDGRHSRLLIAPGNALPWTPVTVGEALAWQDREIAKREADWQRSRAKPAYSEAKMLEAYENMKKIDAAGAERFLAQMKQSMAKMQADAERTTADADRIHARRRTAFDAYRASFSPAQLAGPATLGTEMSREGVSRVDDPRGRPLVKVDPRQAAGDPARIRLLVVALGGVPTDEDYAWQVASQQALDYAALAALLDRP